MTNNLLVSLAVSVIYLLFRLFDNKYISKNDKSVRELVREFTTVGVSVISALFLVTKFNIGSKDVNVNKSPNVFVDQPQF